MPAQITVKAPSYQPNPITVSRQKGSQKKGKRSTPNPLPNGGINPLKIGQSILIGDLKIGRRRRGIRACTVHRSYGNAGTSDEIIRCAVPHSGIGPQPAARKIESGRR